MKTFFTYTITLTLILGFLVSQSIYKGCRAETTNIDEDELIEKANAILKDRFCPCQCGRYLPGSPMFPACFGCSVGKAEITYVLESLEAGKNTQEIILDLSSPIIVDVFADYTNEYLSGIWQLAKKVSEELHQKRVVLRTPGFTLEAQRAIKLAECSRFDEKFSVIQESLINHQGPWDWETLIKFTEQQGHDPKRIRACVDSIDINAQIIKDQQHVEERGIETYPVITINRLKVPSTEPAIRKAIEKVLFESGV